MAIVVEYRGGSAAVVGEEKFVERDMKVLKVLLDVEIVNMKTSSRMVVVISAFQVPMLKRRHMLKRMHQQCLVVVR